MSRRRGEFEHRTSIFEGAFRAWSHLGGIKCDALETKTVGELDPLTNPLEKDERLLNGKGFKTSKKKGNGSDEEKEGAVKEDLAWRTPKKGEYPYEPLPRSGLEHPFVQAILSPWLGPDVNKEGIQVGLTTLRTWWQHRRKGESGSAVAALGTDKMAGVVEGYTRHFFKVAHTLVTRNHENPPRTLYTKMKDAEKARSKRNKKRAKEEEAGKLAAMALNAGLAHSAGMPGIVSGDMVDIVQGLDKLKTLGGIYSVRRNSLNYTPNQVEDFQKDLSPLERLHAAQRLQLAAAGQIIQESVLKNLSPDLNATYLLNHLAMNAKTNSINQQKVKPLNLTPTGVQSSNPNPVTQNKHQSESQYLFGDPNTTPVVFVSQNGDIQIALSIEGITGSHTVKIVETVLKGCTGNKSPISGLLDAACDQKLKSIIVKIDRSSSATRIAFESVRNLAMVGFSAKPKQMIISEMASEQFGQQIKPDLTLLTTAFEVVAATDPTDVFDWCTPCSCPDNGLLKDDCPRHSQMSTRIFEAFDRRLEKVTQLIVGCGSRAGGSCTCFPVCNCKSCVCGQKDNDEKKDQITENITQLSVGCGKRTGGSCTCFPVCNCKGCFCSQEDYEQKIDQITPSCCSKKLTLNSVTPMHISSRNNSIVSRNSLVSRLSWMSDGTLSKRSFSKGSRKNSFMITRNSGTSDLISNSSDTFKRAMSGLSALSIDWENLEDFDVDVDHSACINNSAAQIEDDLSGIVNGCPMLFGGACNCGPTCACAGCPVHDIGGTAGESGMSSERQPSQNQRRSSFRLKNGSIDSEAAQNMQVSFKDLIKF